MMLLALAKRAFEGDRAVREDHFAWRNDHPTSDLRDKTILLVGYGRIGRRVAHLCRAFDMRVEVYDPYLPQESAESITLAPDLFEALGRADAVSLHIPYTQETRHLMGRRAFAALKPGALLVNCSRGETVDETALVGALREGRLGGAGLDVFEGEIPPQDSRSCTLTACCSAPTMRHCPQKVPSAWPHRLRKTSSTVCTADSAPRSSSTERGLGCNDNHRRRRCPRSSASIWKQVRFRAGNRRRTTCSSAADG